MNELVERTGETVQLATVEDLRRLSRLVESPHHRRRPRGRRPPAHTSAIGKVLACRARPDELERRLDGVELERLTEHTITDLAALLDELKVDPSPRLQRRRRGASALGLRCIAMPISDRDDRAIAALSVSMPTPRYSRSVARAAREALAETTALAGVAALERVVGLDPDHGRDRPDRLGAAPPAAAMGGAR